MQLRHRIECRCVYATLGTINFPAGQGLELAQLGRENRGTGNRRSRSCRVSAVSPTETAEAGLAASRKTHQRRRQAERRHRRQQVPAGAAR